MTVTNCTICVFHTFLSICLFISEECYIFAYNCHNSLTFNENTMSRNCNKDLMYSGRRTQVRDSHSYLKERMYDDVYDVERHNEDRYYDYSSYDPEDDNDY